MSVLCSPEADIAKATEALLNGRIYIEKLNGPSQGRRYPGRIRCRDRRWRMQRYSIKPRRTGYWSGNVRSKPLTAHAVPQ